MSLGALEGAGFGGSFGVASDRVVASDGRRKSAESVGNSLICISKFDDLRMVNCTILCYENQMFYLASETTK